MPVSCPLLESLDDDREGVKELGISHPESEVLHATQVSLVALLIEGARFYIDHPKKSTAFYAQGYTDSTGR